MSININELETNVRKCAGPDKAAETLIHGVANRLDELTQDPVAVKALSAELRGNAERLGAAICTSAKPRPKEVEVEAEPKPMPKAKEEVEEVEEAEPKHPPAHQHPKPHGRK